MKLDVKDEEETMLPPELTALDYHPSSAATMSTFGAFRAEALRQQLQTVPGGTTLSDLNDIVDSQIIKTNSGRRRLETRQITLDKQFTRVEFLE